MNTCFIAPLTLLSHMDRLRTRWHMAIAPWVNGCTQYREYYRELSDKGDTVILSGGKDASSGGLVRAAVYIRPTEVVLPASPGNMSKTLSLHKREIMRLTPLRNAFPFRLMGVPEGGGIDEFAQSATDIVELGVDVLGIGVRQDRGEFLQLMMDRNPKLMGCAIHLLGLDSDLQDLTLDIPRSVSTWLPIGLGIEKEAMRFGWDERKKCVKVFPPKRNWLPSGFPRGVPDEYLGMMLDDEQSSIARYNMAATVAIAGRFFGKG